LNDVIDGIIVEKTALSKRLKSQSYISVSWIKVSLIAMFSCQYLVVSDWSRQSMVCKTITQFKTVVVCTDVVRSSWWKVSPMCRTSVHATTEHPSWSLEQLTTPHR